MAHIRDYLSHMHETLTAVPDSGVVSPASGARPAPAAETPEDSDCPHCRGLGWLRADVPVGHPDFGKLRPCVCMEPKIRSRQAAAAFRGVEDLQSMTFDNFNPRGSRSWPQPMQDAAERAYQIARQYAHTLQGWLVLQGAYGSGKTHLAAAIANHAARNGVRCILMTTPNLLDALRAGFQDNSYPERLEELRNTPLLVLDDFGTQNATPWAQEKLFQIVNDRYVRRLPLVVTTNQEFSQIEPRIRSRLQDFTLSTFVRMPDADYRTGKVAASAADAAGVVSWDSLRRFSLGTFRERTDVPHSVRQRLLDAWRACQRYADAPAGNLVIVGDPSTGKTHLAAGIANHAVQMMPQGVLYVSVPDLLDHLRAAFAPDVQHPYTAVFEAVRSVPLLVLDDFGMQNATPWSQEKLFQIVNHRYLHSLPTVVVVAARNSRQSQRIVYRVKANAVTVDLRDIPPYKG